MTDKESFKDIIKKSKQITNNKIESAKTGIVLKKRNLNAPRKDVLKDHEKREKVIHKDHIKRVKVQKQEEEYEETTAMDLDIKDEFTKEEEEEIKEAIMDVEKEESKPKKGFSKMNYDELYKFAKANKMRGYSYLNKDALIDFITQNLPSNGNKIVEEKPKEIEEKEEDPISWNTILHFDEHKLKHQNKRIGYRQIKTYLRKMKNAPSISIRHVYIHEINKIILHESVEI